MKHFTCVDDVDDLQQLLDLCRSCKASSDALTETASERTLVLLFFNPSLRTRLSTEKAAYRLGMQVISMNSNQGWKLEYEEGAVMDGDRAEHVRDAARVISQYADIIGIRSFPGLQDRDADYQDRVVQAFRQYALVPVVSLESAIRHPLQSLTDLMTIREYARKSRPRVVLTWAPHPRALPQAVANSFLEWMRRAEVDLVLTHPRGYELAPAFAQNVETEYDQHRALRDADFVYAKNWSSYQDYGKTYYPAPDWMLSAQKMALTNEAHFMHCLPVRRNVVVEDAVLNSQRALHLEQAKNRTYAAQAVLQKLLQYAEA